MAKRSNVRDDEDSEAEISARHRPDEVPPNRRGPAGSAGGDIHAAGSPLGGSAVGGLGGTNFGDGDPDNADIDAANGSGNFERQLDADEEPAYAGRAGGAVGGSPANKRVSGGKPPRRFEPETSAGESTIGRSPSPKQAEKNQRR